MSVTLFLSFQINVCMPLHIIYMADRLHHRTVGTWEKTHFFGSSYRGNGVFLFLYGDVKCSDKA